MKQWLIVVILFVALAAVMNLLFESVLHISLLDQGKAMIHQPGPGAALTVFALLSVDIFLPIPSSVVMVLSGGLFGTVAGGFLSIAGSLAGNFVGFELMRRYGPTFFGRLVKERELRDMQPVFERYGSAAVVVSRPVPIMMETLTLVAGLLKMPRTRFLLASLIGTAPAAFLYSYAGSSSANVNSTLPAIFMLVSVPAIAWLLFQRRFRRQQRNIS